jgi:hypothetical protein
MNVAELEQSLHEFTHLETCTEHDTDNGGGCLVVYDRTRTGNQCPICDQIEKYQSDLEQAANNEVALNGYFNSASRELATLKKKTAEMKKKIRDLLKE